MRITSLTFAIALAACAPASTASIATTALAPASSAKRQDPSLENVPDYLDPRISLRETLSNTDSVIMPAAVDEVWKAVFFAYDSLGISLNVYDVKRHLIGNQAWNVRQRLNGSRLSKFIDCGMTQIGPNADAYDVVLGHVTYVGVTAKGDTFISTRTAAGARPATYAQSYSRCFPTGELDKRLIAIVTMALKEHR
jgi:hypothetical protein